MTGEKSMFSSSEENGGLHEDILFGDDGKGEVIGLSKVTVSNDYYITNVLLVKSLSYNLLSL